MLEQREGRRVQEACEHDQQEHDERDRQFAEERARAVEEKKRVEQAKLEEYKDTVLAALLEEAAARSTDECAALDASFPTVSPPIVSVLVASVVDGTPHLPAS